MASEFKYDKNVKIINYFQQIDGSFRALRIHLQYKYRILEWP